MTKREQLQHAYNNTVTAMINLTNNLETLGRIATEIYGKELIADACGGFEIEFRRVGNEGFVDVPELNLSSWQIH